MLRTDDLKILTYFSYTQRYIQLYTFTTLRSRIRGSMIRGESATIVVLSKTSNSQIDDFMLWLYLTWLQFHTLHLPLVYTSKGVL